MAKDAFKLTGLPSAEAKARLTADREAAPARKARQEVPLKPFNLRLPVEQVTALAQARVNDGITAVARMRALIAIWQEDADLQQRVAEQATSSK